MPEEGVSIAIIGGGASAALLLAHVTRFEGRAGPLHISIFERTGRFARGIAYSTDRPEHLLNVRASNMSAYADDRAHFVRWLERKRHDYGPDDFVPRFVYGLYLDGIFKQSLKKARENGIKVMLERRAVTGLEGGRVHTVHTAQEASVFDVVIAATGNSAPVTPPGAEKLGPDDGYYNAPWNADYKKIASGGDVVLMGTGLSMVDIILSLNEEGFRGHITAISRHGLIPALHAAPAVYPPFIRDGLPESVYDLFNMTRAHVKRAARENTSWQAVTDSLRPFTNKIWDSWSVQEKKKFRRLAPYWNIHRHRMAPQPATILHAMMNSGKLKIQKDGIEEIGCVKPDLVVKGRCGTYQAAHVINCLGYGSGPGFLFPEGDPSPYKENGNNFYAIGPALAGRHLETVAIPEIREQAALIAAIIGKRMRKECKANGSKRAVI